MRQAPGHEAIGHLAREAGVCALRALPVRQGAAIVLRNYMGLSEARAAEAMNISTGAVRSHLARRCRRFGVYPGRNDHTGSFRDSSEIS